MSQFGKLNFDGEGSYEGEIKNGKPHGHGKFTWPNGDYYEGNWNDNVQEGWGRFIFANGASYEGEWKEDQQHGRGTMKHANGNIYEGEWVEDSQCGKGELRYADGKIYNGEWKNDLEDGWGHLRYPNGDFYEGNFKEGQRHGKGVSHDHNGDTYEGDYHKGVKTGRGVYRWANGESYEGEFGANKRHGQGVHRWPNGDWLAGNWVNDEPDGSQRRHTMQGAWETVNKNALQVKWETVQKPSSSWRRNPATGMQREEYKAMVPTESSLKSMDTTVDDDSFPEDAFEGWQRGNLIGKGAFGAVYLGLLKTGKFVAVKQIELGSLDDQVALEDFYKEMALMNSLHHENIVRYLGCCHREDKSCLDIFLEYVPGGSISTLCKKFENINIDTIRRYTKQILAGLAYLHMKGVIHRDIKGDNILVHNTGCVKLADFGCSKKLNELCSKTHGCNTMVGTPYWMAPEVIANDDSGYGFKADIWSVGCTVVEMLTGKPPWPEFNSMWAAIYHIANSSGSPSGIPKDLDPDCQDFLDQCFERDVSKRPDAEELLRHPWFNGI